MILVGAVRMPANTIQIQSPSIAQANSPIKAHSQTPPLAQNPQTPTGTQGLVRVQAAGRTPQNIVRPMTNIVRVRAPGKKKKTYGFQTSLG